MNFSKEILEKINSIFDNNEEIKNKLLSGDVETIRKIGLLSQKGINPEDIIDAYESKNSENMEYLYNKAKKLYEFKKLYKELCVEYTKEDKNDNEER